jgi:hypothetical protein
VTTTLGENLPNSVADVAVPFPAEWEAELRRVSPIATRFSHLRAYWYRAQLRWVLYDCLPANIIPRDDTPVVAGLTGEECLQLLEGKPPRHMEAYERTPYISDVQHEFFRLHRVYARPFWVLQGDSGGHQVVFSPWQKNVLVAKQLPTDPPKIGSLPPCPFDNRVIHHLQHLNRLHQMQDRVDALERSGSREAAASQLAETLKEIRLAEAQFVEQQMTPLVDMNMSLQRGLGARSEYHDQAVHVKPGKAAEASDAYQRYLETGDYVMSDLAGSKTPTPILQP